MILNHFGVSLSGLWIVKEILSSETFQKMAGKNIFNPFLLPWTSKSFRKVQQLMNQMMKLKTLFLIRKLQKMKFPDGLIAELFKESSRASLPLLNILFNRLFLLGTFPESWSRSIIVPIHKKGNVSNPENFRGISLLDVLGKIYTSIINKRVNVYGKISEAQFGFREGYSTTDNAFILNSLIEKYLAKKKGKLYVCFVNFKRAFLML